MMTTERRNLEESCPNLVSVVIPTKNSSKTIEKCLRSIKGQTYKNAEIIVIDALSTDNTVKLSLTLGAHVIALPGERAKAKNFGISKSRGEFLLFIDSDMELEPTVIEECVRICESNNKVAGVIIPERSIGSSFWVKVRDFERGFYKNSVIESARFFRRKGVLLVGGFDENYVFYEESTLHQKIENSGLNLNVRSSSFILHHEEDFNLKKWLSKKKYYVGSAREYSLKYLKYGRLQSSITYRLGLFVSNDKWKRLLRHPVLTMGLFVLKGLELVFSKL